MSQKPTLLFVAGSWHSPDTWSKITTILEKQQQYKCVCVSLPSVSSNTSASLSDDTKAIRDAIVTETTQGQDVVLVVHSYGGFCGNSAIKSLTRPKQNTTSSTKESTGHVIGVAMIASGFVQTGLSFFDGFAGKPPSIWKLDTDVGLLILTVDPRELFYHDLPLEEGNYWVRKLEKQSLKAVTEGGEDAYSGWLDVPIWYLATTDDKALPIEAQRFFVQTAKDAGAEVTLREVESSHSPMLSKPKETLEFVLEAVAAFE